MKREILSKHKIPLIFFSKNKNLNKNSFKTDSVRKTDL